MQITLSITRCSTIGTDDNVCVNVDQLIASAAEMPFVSQLVTNVCDFSKSHLSPSAKEGK